MNKNILVSLKYKRRANIKEVKPGRGDTEGAQRHCCIVQAWDL